MNTRVPSVSYAGVLTVNVNGCQWITATPRALLEVFSAPRAIETFSGILETIRKRSSAEPNTSKNHLLYRC